MKGFKGILIIGEKNIFSELSDITDMATKANSIMKEMFEHPSDVKMLEEKLNDARILEKQSDAIAFELIEQITGGAISPSIIDNLMEGVHLADNVVDTMFYLCRELYRFSKVEFTHKLGEEARFTEIYLKMFLLADDALLRLNRIFASGRVEEILQLSKEIESIEEQGDDIIDEAFDKLYAQIPKIQYYQFHHFSETLHKSDDVLDSCEDLANVIVSVVTSILK